MSLLGKIIQKIKCWRGYHSLKYDWSDPLTRWGTNFTMWPGGQLYYIKEYCTYCSFSEKKVNITPSSFPPPMIF